MQIKKPVQFRLSEASTLEMFNLSLKEITRLNDGWNKQFGSEYSNTLAFRTIDVYTFRNFILNVIKATKAPYPFIKYDVHSSFTDIRRDGILIAEWYLGDTVIVIEAHRSEPLYMFCGTYENSCVNEFVKEHLIYREFKRKSKSYFESRFGQPFTVLAVAELKKAMDRAKQLESQRDYLQTIKNILKGIRGEVHE